jgi:hypothetical protein
MLRIGVLLLGKDGGRWPPTPSPRKSGAREKDRAEPGIAGRLALASGGASQIKLADPGSAGNRMTTVSLTISEVFDFALKSYTAGKLAEAEQICLKILSADPGSAAAFNLLAVIDTTLGQIMLRHGAIAARC